MRHSQRIRHAAWRAANIAATSHAASAQQRGWRGCRRPGQFREGQLPLECRAAESGLEQAVGGRGLDDLLRHLLTGRKRGRPDGFLRCGERERSQDQGADGAGGNHCYELLHGLLLVGFSCPRCCIAIPLFVETPSPVCRTLRLLVPMKALQGIDESQRLRETLFSQRHLAVRGGVNGGVDPPPQIAKLFGAEHDLPDAGLAAAEDEVVGAGARQLQLRLLNQEQILDGLGQRSEAVLGPGLQLAQLILGLGQCQPAVEVDLERLRRDVLRRNVRVDPRVDADWARGDPSLTGELAASASISTYSSKPRAATWPDCSSPSRLPAPRISRSRIAIAKPAPSSVLSASVARRARASGVSSDMSG